VLELSMALCLFSVHCNAKVDSVLSCLKNKRKEQKNTKKKKRKECQKKEKKREKVRGK